MGAIWVDTQAALGESLRERIDRLSSASPSYLIASPAEEGLFLRRLSLDLRNVVPTDSELKSYLTDVDPEKRTKWIDRFLHDPLYYERMVTWLDLTLMERRPATNVDRQLWIQWLRAKVDEETPIDALDK